MGLRLGVPPHGGTLQLSRLRLLRSRSWPRGEQEDDWRRRGGDEEKLLKDGDPRCRGGLRERGADRASGAGAMRKVAGTRQAIAGGHPATGGDEESDIVNAKGPEMPSLD